MKPNLFLILSLWQAIRLGRRGKKNKFICGIFSYTNFITFVYFPSKRLAFFSFKFTYQTVRQDGRGVKKKIKKAPY